MAREQHVPILAEIIGFRVNGSLRANPPQISVALVDGQMRKSFMSILVGAALCLAASGVARAADMAVKAPAPLPAPIYSWTGFYVGGNVGYSGAGLIAKRPSPDSALVGLHLLIPIR